MEPTSIREARKRVNYSKLLAEKGWYHSFEFPDGTLIDGLVSLEAQKERYSHFPIPADLTGQRVLDIGAWDGWCAFEAERRGASVTAVDCVDIPNFRWVHRKLGSQVDYQVVDLYDLPAAGLGVFDIVFFLGVLYHVRHPLLALEIVCRLTTGVALVDSFVTDGDTWRSHPERLPALEFYETGELGDLIDNWFGPSVSCLLALCRSAGFARVDLLHAGGNHALAACHRHWEPPPAGAGPGPELLAAHNSRGFGINFTGRRDEYLSCWFLSTAAAIRREDLRLEVGGFGSPALFVRREEGARWQANFLSPPGLAAGWNAVRLRLADTDFGNALRIAVAMPVRVSDLAIERVCDGVTWEYNRVDMAGGGFVSCWVSGLPENCDRFNTRVLLAETPLLVDWVGPPDAQGQVQINAIVPRDFSRGGHQLRVECGGVGSAPVPLEIEG
jgi:tRNA (mo5U34)-methyltransferase